MYSPALEAVKGTGHIQRFDGSFATPNSFKGTPNPDIDAAWAGITYENGNNASLMTYGLFANCGRRCDQHIRGDVARGQCFGRVLRQAGTRDWRRLHGFRGGIASAALPEYAAASVLRRLLSGQGGPMGG